LSAPKGRGRFCTLDSQPRSRYDSGPARIDSHSSGRALDRQPFEKYSFLLLPPSRKRKLPWETRTAEKRKRSRNSPRTHPRLPLRKNRLAACLRSNPARHSGRSVTVRAWGVKNLALHDKPAYPVFVPGIAASTKNTGKLSLLEDAWNNSGINEKPRQEQVFNSPLPSHLLRPAPHLPSPTRGEEERGVPVSE